MTTRLRHTPCAQTVDLTDGQLLTNPDGSSHDCPIDGPHHVTRWGTHWTVRNVLDDRGDPPRYPTHALALTEAVRRNNADNAPRRPPTPQPVQPDLFNSQEAIS